MYKKLNILGTTVHFYVTGKVGEYDTSDLFDRFKRGEDLSPDELMHLQKQGYL